MFFFRYYYILLLWVIFLCALSPIFLFPTTHSASAEYTLGNALHALAFARASYCNQDAIMEWTCPVCAKTPPLREVRVFQDTQRETQAFIGVNNDHIVVSFRGTQNIRNWIENLKFCFKPYTNKNCVDCNVHTGFLNTYNSLGGEMLEYLLKLVAKQPNLPLLITGHSLGGALATLAAADFASQSYPSGTTPHIELYTFGAPRLGNKAFVNWFSSLFCKGGHNSYRITHNQDVVPHLPLQIMGFRHTPHELWFSTDKATLYKNCSDMISAQCSNQRVKEDKRCSNSVISLSIKDHLLYFGDSTSCSVSPAKGKSETAFLGPVSEKIKKWIELDHEKIEKDLLE